MLDKDTRGARRELRPQVCPAPARPGGDAIVPAAGRRHHPVADREALVALPDEPPMLLPSESDVACAWLHLAAGKGGLQGARWIESNDPVLRLGVWPRRPILGKAAYQTGVPSPRTGQCEMKPGQAGAVAGLPGVSARICGCQGADGIGDENCAKDWASRLVDRRNPCEHRAVE